jgi:hypothetical protein
MFYASQSHISKVLQTSNNHLLCVAVFAGSYFYSATETKLVVDTSRGERLRVNVSIPFVSIRLDSDYFLYFYCI